MLRYTGLATLLVRCCSILAVRALATMACLAAMLGVAFAQKVEYRLAPKYRDLLTIIDVKSPYRNAEPKTSEPKTSEMKADTPTPETTKAETRPAKTTTSEDQLLLVDKRSMRWHMSVEQVAASNRSIEPTTTSERRNHSNPELGVALLKARYSANGIQHTAFYWFQDTKLVAIVVKPNEARHWPKVNTALEQTYGTPDEDNSRMTTNGQMQCVVKDKKWISERDDQVINFRAQECNQYRHLNFFIIRYESIPHHKELQVSRF